MNYYVVLGIDEDADRETIRSAFRAMVRRYHPDAGAGASAEAFRRVVEAYETLNDPARRCAYDRVLQRPRPPVRSRQQRGGFVEPLGNRPANPAAAARFGAVHDHPPVGTVHIQIDVDEVVDALLSGFGLPFCPLSRPRRF